MENQMMENRGIERLILIFYSIFNLAMTTNAIQHAWGSWIPIVEDIGMLVCWVMYVSRYRDYRFRALATTGMVQLDLMILGIYTNSFFEVTLYFCAFIVVLSVYGLTQVIRACTISITCLLFYHAVIKQTIQYTTENELLHILLQITTLYLTLYIVRVLIRHREGNRGNIARTIENLKRAEHSKDDFLANVSHEIRTPINTICGMSEMILRENISDSVRRNVFDIQNAGRNLQSVVSDILDFSELQSGKMELVEESYNITSTVNDVINMTMARKNKKNIDLIVDLNPNIPSRLLGDEQKLRRVLMNVVNNALKFTKEGCVSIGITYRKESYGINLIIKIKDTGIGMKEEDVEKIFDSFTQVDTKRNRQEGGIGLGLAISRAMVTKMGGFIEIKSEPGKGSEIQVVVPQKVLNENPIVVLSHREQLKIIAYINMEQFAIPEIRDEYTENIRHMVSQLQVDFWNCRNFNELKRRVAREKYSHMFISYWEYRQNTDYFDAVASQLKVIIILDRREDALVKNKKFIRIYKPFYVLPIAVALNGDQVFQSLGDSYREHQNFIAPEASILAVDDNIMNLKVVEGLLRPYKIKVFTALSGEEALRKIDTQDFDFVFMDHMMPEMDGVETLHRIRQKVGNYFQKVPIIALTANAIGGTREMFLSEGFQDFIAKPIEISVMERVLLRNLPSNKIIYVDHESTDEEDSLTTEVSFAEEMAAGQYETEEEAYVSGTMAEEIPSAEQPETEFEAAMPESREETLMLAHINTETGLMYCGGMMEFYIEILQTYYTTGCEKIILMKEAFEKKDWENYRVLVHALKSTSLSIGAEQLSEWAKALEMAAKEGNADYIEEHHAETMQLYEDVMKTISENETIYPKQ